jgi:hypothetical protein
VVPVSSTKEEITLPPESVVAAKAGVRVEKPNSKSRMKIKPFLKLIFYLPPKYFKF